MEGTQKHKRNERRRNKQSVLQRQTRAILFAGNVTVFRRTLLSVCDTQTHGRERQAKVRGKGGEVTIKCSLFVVWFLLDIV